jgi:hypothetical protein
MYVACCCYYFYETVFPDVAGSGVDLVVTCLENLLSFGQKKWLILTKTRRIVKSSIWLLLARQSRQQWSAD